MPQLELTFIVVIILITLCLTLVCLMLCLMNGSFEEFEDETIRVDGSKIDTRPSSPQNDCFSNTLDNTDEKYPAL